MKDWAIKLVVCEDGSTDETGTKLRPGVLYGSEKRRGNYYTFWVMEKNSLNVWDRQTTEKHMSVVREMAGHKGTGKDFELWLTENPELVRDRKAEGTKKCCWAEALTSSRFWLYVVGLGQWDVLGGGPRAWN